jgi:hypothetical protein
MSHTQDLGGEDHVSGHNDIDHEIAGDESGEGDLTNNELMITVFDAFAVQFESNARLLRRIIDARRLRRPHG